MRVAFTLIRRKIWTGGYNYLINLIGLLREHEGVRITPVLFHGADVEPEELAPFAAIASLDRVRTSALDLANKRHTQWEALMMGRDHELSRLFREQRIDVAFEVANFYGWRPGCPVIAWLPDLQHRAMPENFTRRSYWKRELGFLLQTRSRPVIMLSSNDARRACEQYYPHARGRTRVVRFAVPPGPALPAGQAQAVVERYGLPPHFVLMPNQFFRHKNHLLVLEALAILRARGQRIVVAVSGHQADSFNDHHFLRVRGRLEELGLQREFHLLGMVPYADLRWLMHASSGLLNPSHYEGWSTSVEEARTLGLPMLLSDLDVHREQAGDDAYYFDRHSASSLADALVRLPELSAEDRSRRAAAGRETATQRARSFSHDFVELAQQCAGDR